MERIWSSTLTFLNYFLCLWMFCLHVCVPGAYKGRKWALDPLELELEMVVGSYVGPGVLCETSKCF